MLECTHKFLFLIHVEKWHVNIKPNFLNLFVELDHIDKFLKSLFWHHYSLEFDW